MRTALHELTGDLDLGDEETEEIEVDDVLIIDSVPVAGTKQPTRRK